MWDKVEKFVYKNHPEKDATGRASEFFDKHVQLIFDIQCYSKLKRIMLNR